MNVFAGMKLWLLGLVSAIDHAVDAAVLAVAVGVDVRVAAAVFCIVPGAAFIGRGVMLDDEIIPVGHPQVAIGANLGHDRAEPFIGAGHETVGVDGLVAGVLGADVVHAEQVAGGAANERAAVAPCLGEAGAGGKGMAAAGGVCVKGIDLPNVRRDGEEARGVGNHLRALAALAAVDGCGQSAEEGRVIVGRGAEHIAGLIEADAPGVVVKLMQKLHRRTVRAEAEHAHAEAMLLAANLTVEARVTDRAVNPVVKTVAQIARAGVRVARAETGEEHLTHVRLIVAVGVLEKEKLRRMGDDDAAAHEGE